MTTSSRYAELYLSESREHLSAVNEALLSLERGLGPAEPVRELFRAVHSVKGMSAAMGFAAVTELAHELESLLEHLRGGALGVSPEMMDGLFAAADRLEEAVAAAIEGRDGEVDCSAAIERLRALAEPATAAGEPSAPVADVSPSADGRPIAVRLAPDTPLPGVRAIMVLRKLEAVGRVTLVDPPADRLGDAGFDGRFTVWVESERTDDVLLAAVRAAGDVEHVEVGVAAPREPAAPVATPTVTVERRSAEVRAADAPRASGPARAAPGARSARIDLRRLDTLLDLAGELVIARGRLADATEAAAPAVRDAAGQLGRLIGLLQEEVLTTRLVPVWQVFDRFPRLVRDAARALGKDVELVIEGQEIELDRSLLDEIGDPLVHLLRNAVDHGIEMPDERERAGKPRAGRLVLSALRDRDAVLLRVEDDGRGLDRGRVAERARAMGLLADGAALGDDDLVRLVARPGFSTAARVTDLSGRGVGVDAVHARLRALGGTVEMRTREGAGTAVTLRLPLTLAIVRALLARVGDETYVLPASYVTATAELASARSCTVRGEPILVLGEEPLPALDLRELVGLPAAAPDGRELVVLDVRDRRLALVVDELLGQQDVVVKRFDTARGALSCFGGATVLGDGVPALILDVGQLLT